MTVLLVVLMAMPSIATAKTRKESQQNRHNYSQTLSRKAAQEAQSVQKAAEKEARQKKCEAEEALFKAIEEGNLEQVREIVNEGSADLNVTDYRHINEKWSEYTPLIMAAELGHQDIVRFFIEEAGIDVNSRTEKTQETALHAAAYKNQLAIVEYLVCKRIDINAENANGATALTLAASNGFVDIVAYLTAHGANGAYAEKLTGQLSQNSLHSASAAGRLDMVKYLVEEMNVDLLSKDLEGDIPLHHAASNGQLSVVKYFIEEKRVFVDTPNDNGKTPLHYAAAAGQLEVVKYLIEQAYASAFARDKYGWSVFQDAVKQCQLNVIRYLVENRGIDVRNTGAILVISLLSQAANSSEKDVVEYLISKGADVNTKSPTNTDMPQLGEKTALHIAASRNLKDVAEILIKNGADVNAVDQNGNTPLFGAVNLPGNLDVVKVLVSNGADVNTMNDDNSTVLHVAVAPSANIEIVKYLVNHGAVVNPGVDKHGRTVLQASKNWGTGENEVSRYLRSKGAK